MSGEIPISVQTPEAESTLTPRKRLEKFLKEDGEGSVKSQAIADHAALIRIKAMLSEDLSIKKAYSPANLAEQAAINETIRTRKFGPNSSVYRSSLSFAENELFKNYTEQTIQIEADEAKNRGEETIKLNPNKNLWRF